MIPPRMANATRDRGDSSTSVSSDSQSDTRLNPHASTFTPEPMRSKDRSSVETSSMDEEFPPLPKIGHKASSSKLNINAPAARPDGKAPNATSKLKGKYISSEKPLHVAPAKAEPCPALHSDNTKLQAPPPLSIPVVQLSTPDVQSHRRNQPSRGGRGKRRPFVFTWKKQEIRDPLLRAKHEADKRAMEAKTNENVYIDDPESYYRDFKVQYGGYTHLPMNHPAQRDGWIAIQNHHQTSQNRPMSQDGFPNREERGNSVSSTSSGCSYFAPPTPEYGLGFQKLHEHEQRGTPLNPQTDMDNLPNTGAMVQINQERMCSPLEFGNYPYSSLPLDVHRAFEQHEQPCNAFVHFGEQPPMMGIGRTTHMRHESSPAVPMLDSSVQREKVKVDWIKVHRELHERAVSFEDDEVFCKGLPNNAMF